MIATSCEEIPVVAAPLTAVHRLCIVGVAKLVNHAVRHSVPQKNLAVERSRGKTGSVRCSLYIGYLISMRDCLVVAAVTLRGVDIVHAHNRVLCAHHDEVAARMGTNDIYRTHIRDTRHGFFVNSSTSEVKYFLLDIVLEKESLRKSEATIKARQKAIKENIFSKASKCCPNQSEFAPLQPF
jgi:hypothetical protein